MTQLKLGSSLFEQDVVIYQWRYNVSGVGATQTGVCKSLDTADL
jgi:hypothetical protein